MGHLISEPKIKISTPLAPANFWQVPKKIVLLRIYGPVKWEQCERVA